MRGRGSGTRTNGFGASAGARGATGGGARTGAGACSGASAANSGVSGALPKPLPEPERAPERTRVRCHSPSAEASGAIGAPACRRVGTLSEMAEIQSAERPSEAASTLPAATMAVPASNPLAAMLRERRTGNLGIWNGATSEYVAVTYVIRALLDLLRSKTLRQKG